MYRDKTSVLTGRYEKGKNKAFGTALLNPQPRKPVPARNPPLILLHDLSGATLDGMPYRTSWTVFTMVRVDGRRGDFTAVVLRDRFTGQEVIAPLRCTSTYPAVVMILEDYGIFQRFETYDTDPLRPVEKGFVAIRLEGHPDARIPAGLAVPSRHACDAQDARAV